MSDNNMMEEEMFDYSKRKENVATGFYIALVVAWIITIGGAVYTIADLLSPTGKLDLFLSLNLGYQIAIVAIFFAGFFFLLVFFIGFYNRGKASLLRILYKKRELEEQYRNRLDVKLAAAGLLISLVAILGGILTAIIIDFALGSDSGALISLTTILQSISNGALILFIGLGVFLMIGICLFIVYFIRNGYYLILKIFGGLEGKT